MHLNTATKPLKGVGHVVKGAISKKLSQNINFPKVETH